MILNRFFSFIVIIGLILSCQKDESVLPEVLILKDTTFLGFSNNYCQLKYLIYEEPGLTFKTQFYCNELGLLDSIAVIQIRGDKKVKKYSYRYWHQNNGRVIKRMLKNQSVYEEWNFYLNDKMRLDSTVRLYASNGAISKATTIYQNGIIKKKYKNTENLNFDSDSNLLGFCDNGFKNSSINPCDIPPYIEGKCLEDINYVEDLDFDYTYLASITPYYPFFLFIYAPIETILNKPAKSYKWTRWDCKLREDLKINYNFEYKIDNGKIIRVDHNNLNYGIQRSVEFFYSD